jgi:asparagine synthetase B (glutamine-hydrolysing)
MGSKKKLGIGEDALGYYPASMEFGFRFPPKDEKQAQDDKMYVRRAAKKNPFAGMIRDKKTGKFVKAKGALSEEYLKKRAEEAERKHKERMAKTIGGHVYFDKITGKFRRSPTGWKWGGKPFMRPALYQNIGAVMNLIRHQLSVSLPPAFKARIGST